MPDTRLYYLSVYLPIYVCISIYYLFFIIMYFYLAIYFMYCPFSYYVFPGLVTAVL